MAFDYAWIIMGSQVYQFRFINIPTRKLNLYTKWYLIVNGFLLAANHSSNMMWVLTLQVCVKCGNTDLKPLRCMLFTKFDKIPWISMSLFDKFFQLNLTRTCFQLYSNLGTLLTTENVRYPLHSCWISQGYI